MKNCKACRFCYMEPDDMNFICGHKDAGVFGLYIHRAVDGHCGQELTKFEQHPLRDEEGNLRGAEDHSDRL
jgi:hypothetical protein